MLDGVLLFSYLRNCDADVPIALWWVQHWRNEEKLRRGSADPVSNPLVYFELTSGDSSTGPFLLISLLVDGALCCMRLAAR